MAFRQTVILVGGAFREGESPKPRARVRFLAEFQPGHQPGDEDVFPLHMARWLEATGSARIIGKIPAREQ